MDFRIKQLQCFLTLSEVLNYGRTARALYISQPTLTFQIKGLEDSLGVRLFERTRQHVRLTEAGIAFRDYAKSILDTVDAARDCLQTLDSRLRLRIACGPVGQFILLPTVIRALAAEYPHFELEVTEMTTEQQIANLPDGKVDALLMMPALPDRRHPLRPHLPGAADRSGAYGKRSGEARCHQRAGLPLTSGHCIPPERLPLPSALPA